MMNEHITFSSQQFVTVTCERLGIPIASVQTDESATGPSCICDANGCTITISSRASLSDLVHEIAHCLENFRVQEMLRSGALKEGDVLPHHGAIFQKALHEIVNMVYADPLIAHDWAREDMWLTGDPAEFLKQGCTGGE